MIPKATELITVNSTAITLHLYTWPTSVCALSYVVIAYRKQDTQFLSPVKVFDPSNSYTINYLIPMTWYDVKITAVNFAGSTNAFYKIGTPSTAGGDKFLLFILEIKYDFAFIARTFFQV